METIEERIQIAREQILKVAILEKKAARGLCSDKQFDNCIKLSDKLNAFFDEIQFSFKERKEFENDSYEDYVHYGKVGREYKRVCLQRKKR